MHATTILAVLVTLSLAGCGESNSTTAKRSAPEKLAQAKLLIEHNASDEDTGFQGFADHDPWNELTITGPDKVRIVTVTAEGGLRDFGLTELFFETSEPENAVVPIDQVLARLKKGFYAYAADLAGGGAAAGKAWFTHDIPEGAELLSPEDGAEGLDPAGITIAWEPVTEDLAGKPVKIVGYEVIVEEVAELQFPQSFAKPVMSVHLPADATSLRVPAAFMKDDACWSYEVLAIEASGNQTLESAEFTTGAGCVEAPEPPAGAPRMKQAKILIEHNATDADTGFQGFADGDPWNELTVTGPGGVEIVKATPAGGLFDFGLTEFFFETAEPENASVPILQVLEHLPAGTYTFRGVMVGGNISTTTATLTHDIPAGPRLLSPGDGSADVDPEATTVSWQRVTRDLAGDPVTIVGYQVVVEQAGEGAFFPNSFAQPIFSIYLPATATHVAVPAEFMRSDTDYEYEVLAIEVSGNQTLSSAGFSTR